MLTLFSRIYSNFRLDKAAFLTKLSKIFSLIIIIIFIILYIAARTENLGSLFEFINSIFFVKEEVVIPKEPEEVPVEQPKVEKPIITKKGMIVCGILFVGTVVVVVIASCFKK